VLQRSLIAVSPEVRARRTVRISFVSSPRTISMLGMKPSSSSMPEIYFG
jgi:hypothetical protein